MSILSIVSNISSASTTDVDDISDIKTVIFNKTLIGSFFSRAHMNRKNILTVITCHSADCGINNVDNLALLGEDWRRVCRMKTS